MNVTLIDGLKIGEEIHREAELREATAGDMIDATEESEIPVLTPDGYELLVSNTRVGINTLRRQIVRIGSHDGPLTLGEIKKFSGRDLNLLNQSAEALQTASLQGVSERGKA